MHFLIQLKRANVASHELILFYTSCIRSVMTYASPAFFYALPLFLKKDLENVEKRALSIICPGLTYRKALEFSNIMPINDYIASLCKKTFLSFRAKSPRVLRSPRMLNECNLYCKIVKYCILSEVCMVKTVAHSTVSPQMFK